MDVIILAGGLGTRLRSVVSEVPKCMADVNDKPFIYYLLSYLNRFDKVHKVVLSVGYLKEVIFQWIEVNGSQFAFSIEYAVEDEPLGTGGAIRLALQKTKTENVLVLNGDTFFDVNINEFYEFHISNQALISVALKPMKDFERYGTVELEKETSKINSFVEKKFTEHGLINGGVYLINRNKIQMNHLPDKFSFETDILETLVSKRQLTGFYENQYFIDIGIPDDYKKAKSDFKKLFRFNIPNVDYNRFETLFLDRDGVINVLRKNDYVKSWDEFRFTQGILDALAEWSKYFKDIIIITNQRGVAKGIMSENDLNKIHNKMIEQINKFGGRIDKIYYCTAIDDENPFRKPNPGMAYQAKRDFPDIDFSKTLMIGDSESDFVFSQTIGCSFMKYSTSQL